MFKSYDIESGLFRWRESLHYFKRGEMMRYVRRSMTTLTTRIDTLIYLFGSYDLSKYFEIELYSSFSSQKLFMRKDYNKISVLGFSDK